MHLLPGNDFLAMCVSGLESVKAGDHEAAFECFQASAQQNYSKAQYNVGVCYEMGRGVRKDLRKVHATHTSISRCTLDV